MPVIDVFTNFRDKKTTVYTIDNKFIIYDLYSTYEFMILLNIFLSILIR